jgi:hypothetical protein
MTRIEKKSSLPWKRHYLVVTWQRQGHAQKYRLAFDKKQIVLKMMRWPIIVLLCVYVAKGLSLPLLPSTEWRGTLKRAVAYKDRKNTHVDRLIAGSSGNSDFQPYQSLKNSVLQKAINRIYHVSHNLHKGLYIFDLSRNGRQSLSFYAVGQLPVQLLHAVTCYQLFQNLLLKLEQKMKVESELTKWSVRRRGSAMFLVSR